MLPQNLYIRHHIRRARSRTSPSALIPWGFLRKMLFTMTVSLRKAQFCSILFIEMCLTEARGGGTKKPHKIDSESPIADIAEDKQVFYTKCTKQVFRSSRMLHMRLTKARRWKSVFAGFFGTMLCSAVHLMFPLEEDADNSALSESLVTAVRDHVSASGIAKFPEPIAQDRNKEVITPSSGNGDP
jgi:hypothetical protein